MVKFLEGVQNWMVENLNYRSKRVLKPREDRRAWLSLTTGSLSQFYIRHFIYFFFFSFFALKKMNKLKLIR